MEKELNILKEMIAKHDPKAESYLKELAEKYNSPEDNKLFTQFASELMDDISSDMDHLEADIKDYTLKQQLGELSDAINFAYVARHYFGKSKAWLYQRMKGNIVNGKHAQFTPEEREIFNNALKDLGEKLESAASSYA
jgi:hypothetical protein